MRVTLGMICQNEEYYLSKILPIIRTSFDEFVAVDGGSTDHTKEILRAHSCKIVEKPWDNNFSNARNELMPHATGDWMVVLDADEAMFPNEIERLKSYMGNTTFLYYPRYNFAGDHDHWAPEFYPDRQGRAYKLNMGYHWRGLVHAIICRGNDQSSAWERGYGLQVNDVHIYHYGACKPKKVQWLKIQNYDRIHKGLPLLKGVPPDVDFGTDRQWTPFMGPHPLKDIPPPPDQS